MANKKVLLIIRDGWGLAKPDKFNAVENARTPNMRRYAKDYPTCVLEPSGESVGLPKGYMGSSEVGHLNIGAGRIVIQELKRIKDMIEDGSFFACSALKAALDNCVKNGSALHLMGLLQDEGVHAHQDHLYSILREAKRRGVKQAWVHIFSDGRDTPPRSGLAYVKMLDEVLAEVGNAGVGTLMGLLQDEGVHAHQDHLYSILREAKRRGVKQAWVHIFSDGRDTPPRSGLAYVKMLDEVLAEVGNAGVGTLMGRYYAMDRGEKWSLTDKSYDTLTKAEGPRAKSAAAAIEAAYATLKNPNGQPIVDEYIPPTVIEGYPGMKEGDSVVHFNFRQDRAIQLTKCFVEDNYPGKRWKKLDVTYCGLTRYYDEFKFSALPPMDEGGGMDNLLGQVLAERGLRQLRLAETQKFKHVTSFFNGKRTEPYKGEDQVEIKGTWDPATFGEHPEMDAPRVRERALAEIGSGKYDFILVNFANCDMVGHTGIYDAVVKAVETVDDSVKLLVDKALENGYTVMISSDHGNAEEMWDYRIDMPKTSHTTNPVDFIFISKDAGVRLREHGILADIAPTVLQVLGLPQPADMTAKSLLA